MDETRANSALSEEETELCNSRYKDGYLDAVADIKDAIRTNAVVPEVAKKLLYNKLKELTKEI